MSMMSTEAVGMDFNIGGNYAASLSQMIAQSDVYARSADTMIGKVALLNVGVTALVAKTNALTGANKIATAEAAAYQQKLAGIKGTADVTGQSFAALEKTTLSLGRSYGSLGSAVATVEALGSSGVTATKSVESLAKSWLSLGVANQTSGVALGQTLLTLGRTFGNSERQLQSYGDSLTATSKRYGASADAALGFAKALSPVAASVGMTEGSVIGLGVAAARLGESGFAGANAFNKVLLDMGRSIRNGSPEIKEYASLLGMTQKNLAGLFKEDPTEVLVRFTEAIGKGGPQAMRSLELLGLDATRTVRAITALSTQGNLRKIIDESTTSYGSGDTAKAAAASLDTVNHQMASLGETMSQTVASAGKPFLGFLDGVLKGANAAASAVNALVGSAPMQALGKVGAVGSFGVSAGASIVSTLGLVGLGTAAFRGARGGIGNFRAGAAGARAGEGLADDAGRMMQMGAMYGRQMPEPLLGNVGGQLGATAPWGGRIRGVGRAGLNFGAIAMDASGRMMEPLSGRSIPYSEQGQTLRGGLGAIWGGAGGGVNVIDDFGKKITKSAVALETYTKDVTTATGSMSRFTAAGVRLAGTSGMAIGGIAGAGTSMLGRGIGAMGLNPYMLGATGALIGYEAISGFKKDQQAKEDFAVSGSSDAWGTFNEFAAAAGIAGKGLVSLGEQIAKTTQDIADATPLPSGGGQIAFTAEMASQAAMPGYQRAFTLPDDQVNPGYAATRWRLMAGDNPSGAVRSRLAMDFASQGGNAQDALDAFANQDPRDIYRSAINQARDAYGVWGATEESAAIGKDIAGYASRRVQSAVDVYGSGVSDAARTNEVRKLYDTIKGESDPYKLRTGSEALASLTGMDAEYFKRNAGMGESWDFLLQTTANGKLNSGGNPNDAGNTEWARRAMAQQNPGFTNIAGIAGNPQGLTEAKRLDDALSMLTGHASSLGSALYEAEGAAKKYGVSVEELTGDQTSGMTGLGKALTEYRQAPNEQNRGAAGAASAAAALRGSGGSFSVAQASLLAQMAPLSATDFNRTAYATGQQQLAMGQIVGGRTMGMYQRTSGAIQAGQIARGMGVQTDPEIEQQRQATLQAEQEAYGERIDFQKSFIMASRNLDISLERQAEDTARSRARAEEDYQRQVSYSTADFYRQRRIAERDFGISMARAAEDSAKSLYDPYQRIQAQMVWDGKSMLTNLAEQNKALQQQTGGVNRLRRMGLSRQAVDTLSLTDPRNAQQVQRMLDEAGTNPALLRAINAMIAQRVRSGRAATQSDNNVDYRRATEDFDRGMRDSSRSFGIQMGRMADAHALSMQRMSQDVARSRHRAMEDLVRMGADASDSLAKMSKELVTRVGKMPASIREVMSDNLKLVTATAVQDATRELSLMADPAGLAKVISDLFEKMSKRWRQDYPTAYNNWGKGGGTDHGPIASGGMANPYPGASVTQGFSGAHPALDLSAGAGDADAGRTIRSAGAGRVSSAMHTATSGGVIYVDHGGGRVTNYRHLNAGSFAVRTGSSVGPGTPLGVLGKTRLSVSNPSQFGYGGSHNSGAHLHFSMLKSGSFIDPGPYWQGKRTWMKDGGIATRQLNATLGEAGHEAVLPLNVHGAKVLAETMVRYVDATKVQTARMNSYTSVVNSYHYDQSVQFSGPVSVQAQDPMSMGRQLEEQARLKRLIQPVGR